MKPIILALTLTGCVLSPEYKIDRSNHEIPITCMDKVDSVTFSDSGEIWHYSCTLGAEPRPPKAPK